MYITSDCKTLSRYLGLNVEPKIIKMPRKNVSEKCQSFLTLVLAMDFWIWQHKAQATKANINKWDYIKTKKLLHREEIHQ